MRVTPIANGRANLPAADFQERPFVANLALTDQLSPKYLIPIGFIKYIIADLGALKRLQHHPRQQ